MFAIAPAAVLPNLAPQRGQFARFGRIGPRPSSAWQREHVQTWTNCGMFGRTGCPGMTGRCGGWNTGGLGGRNWALTRGAGQNSVAASGSRARSRQNLRRVEGEVRITVSFLLLGVFLLSLSSAGRRKENTALPGKTPPIQYSSTRRTSLQTQFEFTSWVTR
jgi:hypothetical protein